ncbi:hypothetical protein AB349_15115 [Listeria monocytogenes]|uniref:Lipoprotein n=1 Tax=Listeria monocytogenes serotype 4a (strain M7) TaxID=1030009 RepID=A0A0E0UWQ5_LISMM|nr:hypothetical protein [Listeria monocytogenes]ACK39127.1 lipoprotein, putative [Listeria monocytogenes HCC23]AEH92882.1 hypothetical protein LMM7_1877 [Listeria monocytogenes M7]AKS54391.1 hypothetical protein LM850658_09175 [Listeria monocytogenes]EAC6862379.1 hypothetical protein [Listeria monocytogenes]EAC7122373.1 hypothetical protein [Listeria monocytogenes]
MKRKITMIICLVSLSLLTACSNSKSVKEKPVEEQTSQSGSETIESRNGVVSSHGKYLELAEDVNALEKDAPIIIKATKKSEKVTVTKETKENVFPTDFYTMSDVQINSIEKDTTGKLKENMTIKVLEYSVENVTVDGEEYDLTIDGYKNMEKGEAYTLFLEKNPDGDNYILSNAIISKFPVEELPKEELFLDGGDPTEETVVIEEIYQEVYEDVLKEYN